MTDVSTPWRLRVTQPYLPPREDYEAYLADIWDRRWLTNGGPCEAALEAKLKQRLGIDHLQLVSSGTSALQLALAALDLDGDVVVTPYSFAATRNAVIRQGCRPVYADIDSSTFALDPEAVERAITPRTQAILVTTAYGLPCHFDRIREIAQRHGIRTVYDHAHAVGASYNGRSLPAYGDIGALSFHTTKVFHTVEGGAVVSHCETLDEKLRLLKSNGIDGEDIPHVGINAKMSEMHAAMGLAVLPRLDRLIADRRERFRSYAGHLAEAPVRMLRPDETEGLTWNYCYAPIVLDSGETTRRVQDALARARLESRRYFRPAFTALDPDQSCPVAEDMADRVLCLPFSPFLREEQIAEVSDIVREHA